ncbi:MAG: putative ATP-grasp-modified RiPP [Micromonosporaceae bacterium]
MSTATSSGSLATVGDRFALSRPCTDQPAGTEQPSAARPFGLRFAADPVSTEVALPAYEFDPVQQLLVDPATAEPWYRGLVDMTMNTTGISPDGGGSTGNEEYRPDYTGDEPV